MHRMPRWEQRYPLTYGVQLQRIRSLPGQRRYQSFQSLLPSKTVARGASWRVPVRSTRARNTWGVDMSVRRQRIIQKVGSRRSRVEVATNKTAVLKKTHGWIKRFPHVHSQRLCTVASYKAFTPYKPPWTLGTCKTMTRGRIDESDSGGTGGGKGGGRQNRGP